jgi:hypothetical protein
MVLACPNMIRVSRLMKQPCPDIIEHNREHEFLELPHIRTQENATRNMSFYLTSCSDTHLHVWTSYFNIKIMFEHKGTQ